MRLKKIFRDTSISFLALSMLSGYLPQHSFLPVSMMPVEINAEGNGEETEERTAYVPLTYTVSSYPKGDDVEYKLTISKKMYPSSSVSFSQIGKGELTYPIDINVSVVLGGKMVTRRIQQTVKINTETGAFTISDSTIGEIAGEMNTKEEINVYGESKVPEGKHEVDAELYENVYDPTAFNDIGGYDAINQMKMSFIDAITKVEMETQLSKDITVWQKNEETGLPVLRTLQVIYVFSDVDSCRNEDYTEGVCPKKGEHTFIQTQDSYYFAVDEVTRTIFLEQGTQTRYKLKYVSEWSDWNHKETDRVWEDDYPRPDSTSLNQTVTKVDYPVAPRIFKKLTLPDEEAPDAEANEVHPKQTLNGWVSSKSHDNSTIKVTENKGPWTNAALDFVATTKSASPNITPSANSWSQTNGVWMSTNHSSSTTSALSFSFNISEAATLTFDWSVSSESTSYDYLYYTISKDGSTLSGTGVDTKIGGTSYGTSDSSMTYMTRTHNLQPGSYVVTFNYRKDGSVNKGTDKGYVKNFKLSETTIEHRVKEYNIGESMHSNNHADNSSSTMSYSFTLVRPGKINFDWAVHSEPGDYGYYTLTKNGAVVSGTGTGTKMSGTSSCDVYIKDPSDSDYNQLGTSLENMKFTHVTKELEAGNYVLTFTYKKNAKEIAGLDTMFVKNFNVEYSGSFSPDAIGNSFYSTNHTDNSTSTMSYSFALAKKGTLNFDWTCSSESVNTDYLYYTITKDGKTLSGTGTSTKIGGSTQGTTPENLKFLNVNKKLDPGNYVVTFTYRKDGSNSKYLDTAFVKNFSVFHDIVLKPDRPDAIWMESSGIWQSNNITDESQNELTFEFSIANSGKLSFDYTVSSDAGDVLFYTLEKDGAAIETELSTRISGTSRGTSASSLSYISKSYALDPGRYVLKFNYKKDSNPAKAGLDKGFIRNLAVSEVREIVNVYPNTGDTSYLDEYPENAILLDQRDYKVYWQRIEEGQFLRKFSHDWTHKYIFQNTHLGGYGYEMDTSHPASGMTIKFAMYAKYLKDGNGKSSEYYLARKVDDFKGNKYLMGSGSWFNGDQKDKVDDKIESETGNKIYNTEEDFKVYKKYCDMEYEFSNGCSYKWNDSVNKTVAQNENGNKSCTHYHNTIKDSQNVCASPNSCTVQTINSCTNRVSNGSFYQEKDPDNAGYLRTGSKTAKTCSVSRNTGSYQTRESCNGCEIYEPSCTHCVKSHRDSCCSYACGDRTCGKKGTSCCYNGACRSCTVCDEYKDYTKHCCDTYKEKTHYYVESTTKTDGRNCGWDFPNGNTSTLRVKNTDSRAPANAECGWTKESSEISFKHCGYNVADAPTLRTYYFKVRNFTEETDYLAPPFIINSSGTDQETDRYPLKMTSTRSKGSSVLQFDTGWYQDDYKKDALKNWELSEVREDELIDAYETWEEYRDVDTYREEWRTEYRWKTPVKFEEKYTLDETEAKECATQTGRYAGPIGSCVIVEQITVPKYVEQEVTEVLPGSRTSPAAKNLTIPEVEARAELYAEGQYQLYVYQNMPTRNLAVNNNINSQTGFVGQEISTIKLKEDYQDAYVNFSNKKESIKSSAKTTYFTTFRIWDIYMYIVGHSRYASVSNPAYTLSGKSVIEYPFTFTVTNGGIGCGPGLTPPEEGCPLGTEILVTSLLLSNQIADKGMNSLVYTSTDGKGSFSTLLNGNDENLTKALCRSPESYYFTVKNYDDVDALVNMIIAEQEFKETSKTNAYSDGTFKVYDKYGDESTVDGLFQFLMSIEESDNSPAMQAIKELEKTNIMELLKTGRDIPDETFKEACDILGIEFESPDKLMEYYDKMKNAGLTLEDINEQYGTTLTPAQFRSHITEYRKKHSDTDVHNRLAFIDYETGKLLDEFGTEEEVQNERIQSIVKTMCNK